MLRLSERLSVNGGPPTRRQGRRAPMRRIAEPRSFCLLTSQDLPPTPGRMPNAPRRQDIQPRVASCRG
eukprot:9942084-Alexandrium_andersonii.AAC.1